MKSDYETLKAENATLKETIAAFEQRLSALEKANDPDVEWKEYYSEYSVKYESETIRDTAYYVRQTNLNLYTSDDISESLWLFVFADLDGKNHFFEYDVDNSLVRFDKFYNDEAIFVEDGPIKVDNLNFNQSNYVPIDAAYRKPK